MIETEKDRVIRDLLIACKAARRLGTLAQTHSPHEVRVILDGVIANAEKIEKVECWRREILYRHPVMRCFPVLAWPRMARLSGYLPLPPA